MMTQITIALAGFSIIALILLLLQKRSESKTATLLAQILLCVLIITQLIQVMYITGNLVFSTGLYSFYLLSLALVGPLFYLYSQHIIDSNMESSRQTLWHFLAAPIFALLGFLFPNDFTILYSLVFLIGGIYMSRLAWSLYQLRKRRVLFKMEFLFIASFLTWSLAVVFIGVLSSQVISFLISTQTIMLSLLIAVTLHIQLNYPHLLSSLEEFSHRHYQTSTLLNIDCASKKKQLKELMTIKKIYQDSELSLSSCATLLSLKPHQLSELINTQLDMSFSAYLRQQRVTAAELLLQTEPKISVLAIGLSVGFSSQSAFYSAFKDIHAIAPGQYRKQIVIK